MNKFKTGTIGCNSKSDNKNIEVELHIYFSKVALILLTPELEDSSFTILNVPIFSEVSI